MTHFVASQFAVLLVVLCSLQFGSLVAAHVKTIPIAELDAHVYEVPSISHGNLVEAANSDLASGLRGLRDALTGEGMVMVSGIPGFGELRRKVLVGMHVCGSAASEARTTVFEDSTARQTLAATVRGNGELGELNFGEAAAGACSERLMQKVKEFREVVSATAEKFTAALDRVFKGQYRHEEGEPLLWGYDHIQSYDTLSDVVRGAEHLEHFHSYYKPVVANSTSTDSVAIDLHADQGIFIAFTPGILVAETESGEIQATTKAAGKFFVQLRDGSQSVAKFGFDRDVLVFLLGDGVDQYINPKLSGGPFLRAAPHAMVMPRHGEKEWRAWYGRMFLPPADALSETHGVTFGQLREQMISGVHEGSGVGTGIGCSRRLQETDSTECGENQMYCWMRCMDYTETKPQECAAKVDVNGISLGGELKCVSQFDQVYRRDIDTHGDYNPLCSSSTENVTAAPALADTEWAQKTPYSECTGWDAFLDKDAFQSSVQLKAEDTTGAGELYLLYSIMEGKLHAKMAYKGVAGWLAMGPTNHGGGHNGMNGAHIVMGNFDPDPSIDDNVFDPIYTGGTGVATYIVDEQTSAFRHWVSTKAEEGLSNATMSVDTCFTSMTFTVDGAIAGDPLNMTGLNSLIWGVHTDGLYKGYHGYSNRGHLCLDFTTTVQQAAVSPYAEEQPAIFQDCVYPNAIPPPPATTETPRTGASDDNSSALRPYSTELFAALGAWLLATAVTV